VKPLLAWCPAKYKNHHRTFLSTLPPIPADQAKGVLRSTLVSSVEHPENLTLSPHSTLKNPTLELLSPFLNHGTVLFLLCVAAMLKKRPKRNIDVKNLCLKTESIYVIVALAMVQINLWA